MSNDMTFTEWKAELKKALVLRGWSLKDLAESTGYQYQYVCAISAGTQFSKQAIRKISDELGIEPLVE